MAALETRESASELDEFEVLVLRDCAGEVVEGLTWGGAMGQAVEVLRGSGYLERGLDGRHRLTSKGLQFLKAYHAREPTH